MELETIDQSIANREMSVKVQPPTDIRRRYETDGKRQIEKSRLKPMAIQVDPHFSIISKFLFLYYLVTKFKNL
jgi:hypothetical protein